MNAYKIKINCTNTNSFNYNNIKITEKNKLIKLKIKEIANNIDFIHNCFLLYKTLKLNNITIKTLEFCLNRNITDNEIISFIRILKNNGFKSKPYVNIKLFQIKNNKEELIKIINFNNETPKEISENKKKFKNNSLYISKIIYSKTKNT